MKAVSVGFMSHSTFFLVLSPAMMLNNWKVDLSQAGDGREGSSIVSDHCSGAAAPQNTDSSFSEGSCAHWLLIAAETGV